MKEQTPDAQPENSAHGYTEGAYVQEHLSSSKEHLSTSKPESRVSEELTQDDWERIRKLACSIEYDMGNDSTTDQLCELGGQVTKYERAKQAELVEENERYKEALQCMMNVEHHGDFMNAFFDLKDQVKAALQGE